MSGFIDINNYPKVVDLCDEIINDFDKLKTYARRMNFIPWPEDIYRGKWTVSSFKYRDKQFSNAFPWLNRPELQTAGFSTMYPGTNIAPHRGNAGDILRLHLGVDCHGGNCKIRVGDQERGWSEGEFLMFSDEELHCAWNHSQFTRTVFLFDVKRSMISN